MIRKISRSVDLFKRGKLGQRQIELGDFMDEKIHESIYGNQFVMMDGDLPDDKYNPRPYGTKRTYSQDWPLYEKAASQEKLMFLRILKDAVDYMMIDYHWKGNGRPPVYYADIIKCLCIKSFNNYSSWRAESEFIIAKSMGIIDSVPKRTTLIKYLKKEETAKLLNLLYQVVAEPLSDVEQYFAADSSGISNRYGNTRWIKIRHTPEEMKHKREYSKLHIITGIKTNVICAAKITKGQANDSPQLPELLDGTSRIFKLKEVSADAGYLSRENVKAIIKVGAVPYIKGKKNVNITFKGRDSAWNVMLKKWKYSQMQFAQHYNLRSNVESTFSMMKRKFGDFCRSKKEESQESEILCRIVCHNIVVLAEALLSYNLSKGFMT